MFQTAIAGPPLTQDPNTQLITDSLRDFLHPDDTELRLIVPVVGGSLSLGVQAVVEWAWERDVKVAAVHGQNDNNLTDVEYQFLEDADESVISLDAAQTVALVLKQALPNACLIVAPFGEVFDDFTRSLMALCFEHEIPVYDLSAALMEVDPYDSWENEGGTAEDEAEEKPEEEPQEAAQEATEGAEEEPQEEDFPAADIFEELERIERQADQIGKASMVIRDRARALKSGQPTAQEPRPAKTRNGIEISRNGMDGPWLPRGRGRAPKDSIERDAVTKEILRRN